MGIENPSQIVTKFDKRLIERDGEPGGYKEHIATLKCAMCGSWDPCKCVWNKGRNRLWKT